MKKSDQIVGSPAASGPGRSERTPKREFDTGAGKRGNECGSGGMPRRRRSAGSGTKQQSIWPIPVHTALVGPNVLLMEGLARILTAAGFRIVASKPDLDNRTLNTLPQEKSILLIIDVSADFDAGLRQIERFKQRYSGGRVVVLADQHHPIKMISAFRVGANAYLAKISTAETFVRLIELVALGVTLLPPEILSLISDRNSRSAHRDVNEVADVGHTDDNQRGEIIGAEAVTNEQGLHAECRHLSRLSARQQAILRFLAEGCSNKVIARKLTMAEVTVKAHVKAILRKIRVHNRTQAAIWAMSNAPSPEEGGIAQMPAEPCPGLDVEYAQSDACKNGSGLVTEVSIAVSSILRVSRKND